MPGSAPEGQWGFEDSEGNSLNGGEATIPILEELGHNRYQFIATGFFITDSGLFVTAKHVLESFSPERLVAWQFLPGNEYFPRPILAFSCHENVRRCCRTTCSSHQSDFRRIVHQQQAYADNGAASRLRACRHVCLSKYSDRAY